MLIIGDSLSSDIRGGNHAGIDTCWLNPAACKTRAALYAPMKSPSWKELYPILESVWRIEKIET